MIADDHISSLGYLWSTCLVPISNRRKDSVGKRQIDRRILGSFPVVTTYDTIYGKAPPERGTFFRLEEYERVGILLVEVYKSVIWVCERANR